MSGIVLESAVGLHKAYLKAVHSSPRLPLHEAIHDIKQLLNALINADFLATLHYPLILPTGAPHTLT